MAEQGGHEPDEGAVASALAKVLAIALVIGAIVAGGIFLVVRTLGLGAGDTSATDDLPGTGPTTSPLPTVALTVPGSSSPSASASESATGDPSPARKLTLSAAQSQVAPGQRIDLTGQYAGQDGTVLEVQRREGGSWTAFSDVTARVAGGSFSTYVTTSRGGEQRFRVFDDSADQGSNPVVVTVG